MMQLLNYVAGRCKEYGIHWCELEVIESDNCVISLVCNVLEQHSGYCFMYFGSKRRNRIIRYVSVV